ncbi:MAG: ferritin-like domain-containing protein [Agromyces sp.]
MRLATLEDMFAYRLGAALTMEHDSLEMLADLERAASSQEVKAMFSHHAEETREQVENLHSIFERVGIEEKEKPSPTTKGLAHEGQALIEKVGVELRDVAALTAASGTEHFEIASYRSLISIGRALGLKDAIDLLASNLQQEEHTSKELEKMVKLVLADFAPTATP